MSNTVDADMKALRADLAQLREDFAQVLSTLKQLTAHSGEKLCDSGSESSAEFADQIRKRVSSVAKEIEDKPLTSAFAAFAGGVLIASLLKSTR